MAVRARHRIEIEMNGAVARQFVALAIVALLTACASGPPPLDWQANAKSALDRATAAYLTGDTRVEADEFERARGQLARTGRADLLARAELMRCAARVASLVFETCAGFDALRTDAAAPERAYAEYLSAHRLSRDDIARLPPAQQTAAAALTGGIPAPASIGTIDDPLSRLIAIAVLFQRGQASPALIAVAAETASAQGWRRPLVAWLKVQALRAQQGGDAAEAERLLRRIELVLSAK